MDSQKIPIYDLYDIWYEPFWCKPWFIPSILLLFLLLFSLLIWYFLKKRKKKKIIKDPWDHALQKMNALNLKNFADTKIHKKFYSQVTTILKEYYSRRYGLFLQSKTDEEVVEIIYSSEFPHSLYESLRGIFQGAQYIKFANQDAAVERIKNDLKISMELIKKTIPQ